MSLRQAKYHSQLTQLALLQRAVPMAETCMVDAGISVLGHYFKF